MTLGIQVYEIKHVLLADRWHEVEPESFALDAYEFMEGNQAVARGDGQLITSVVHPWFRANAIRMVTDGKEKGLHKKRRPLRASR